MQEGKRHFLSSTLMGKEEAKKINQLLQCLLDSSDSYDFRTPVDYVGLRLVDYPLIVKKPMDLGTVKKYLNSNSYETVEDCLSDIQLIWDNCKLYNTPDFVSFYLMQWIYKLAEKLEKMTKKMIKNYVPFVVFDGTTEKKKGPPKKEAPAKKVNLPTPPP